MKKTEGRGHRGKAAQIEMRKSFIFSKSSSELVDSALTLSQGQMRSPTHTDGGLLLQRCAELLLSFHISLICALLQ